MEEQPNEVEEVLKLFGGDARKALSEVLRDCHHLHGSVGLASAENQRPISIEVATAESYTRPPLHDFFMTRYTEAYANEIASFIAAIESGALISPSGEDGMLALQLADAALESVRTDRRITLA